ncbi:MAG: decarboxylase [Gammaproteobacteria bacterium]
MADSTALKGASLIRSLKKSRVEVIAALPDIVTCDAILWPITRDADFTLVPVCKEDEGVSICAALSYCNKRAALLIQHTGFLDSINAIRCIAMEYQLPIVMIVGLQGMEPDRAPLDSGKLGIRILEPICAAMGLSYKVLTGESHAQLVSESIDWAYENSRPIALLIATTPTGDA